MEYETKATKKLRAHDRLTIALDDIEDGTYEVEVTLTRIDNPPGQEHVVALP